MTCKHAVGIVVTKIADGNHGGVAQSLKHMCQMGLARTTRADNGQRHGGPIGPTFNPSNGLGIRRGDQEVFPTQCRTVIKIERNLLWRHA